MKEIITHLVQYLTSPTFANPPEARDNLDALRKVWDELPAEYGDMDANVLYVVAGMYPDIAMGAPPDYELGEGAGITGQEIINIGNRTFVIGNGEPFGTDYYRELEIEPGEKVRFDTSGEAIPPGDAGFYLIFTGINRQRLWLAPDGQAADADPAGTALAAAFAAKQNTITFAGRKVIYVSKETTATDVRTGLSAYDYLRPFASLTAAQAAATAGDLIIVMPGTYTDGGDNATNCNLGKNGVDWYFMPGAKIVIVSDPAGSPVVDDQPYGDEPTRVVFGDLVAGVPTSMTYQVRGYGEFVNENPELNVGAEHMGIGVYHSTSDIFIECRSIEAPGGFGFDEPSYTGGTGVWVRNGKLTVRAESVTAYNSAFHIDDGELVAQVDHYAGDHGVNAWGGTSRIITKTATGGNHVWQINVNPPALCAHELVVTEEATATSGGECILIGGSNNQLRLRGRFRSQGSDYVILTTGQTNLTLDGVHLSGGYWSIFPDQNISVTVLDATATGLPDEGAYTVTQLVNRIRVIGATEETNGLTFVNATPSLPAAFDADRGLVSMPIADFLELVGAAQKTPNINGQTVTTYTLVLTDAGKIITATHADPQTYTIPTNASIAFPVGTIINVIQAGAGAVTLEGDTGVTVNGTSAGSVATTTQYQGAALLKTGENVWIISGAVE